MSDHSDFQSPDGRENTTVTVLPPSEPVTDLMSRYPAPSLWSSIGLPLVVQFGSVQRSSVCRGSRCCSQK